MEVRTIDETRPMTVKIEVEFDVKNPAKLVANWAKLDHANEILCQEPDNPINWANCILDLMTNAIDEEKLGIEFNSSTCDKNPDAHFFYEYYEDEEFNAVPVTTTVVEEV